MLERLVLSAGIPVLMIAGNHDSSERLGFGSKLLNAGGFHVFGPLSSAVEPVVLPDAHGEVHFCPLPFADPAVVRLHLDDDSLHSHEAAVRALARTPWLGWESVFCSEGPGIANLRPWL